MYEQTADGVKRDGEELARMVLTYGPEQVVRALAAAFDAAEKAVHGTGVRLDDGRLEPGLKLLEQLAERVHSLPQRRTIPAGSLVYCADGSVDRTREPLEYVLVELAPSPELAELARALGGV